MMKVFEKAGLRLQAKLENGIYNLEIPFYADSQRMETD
jgi:hypothetical protein